MSVEQDEENEDLSKRHPQIFTTYVKQNELRDGRLHFLSSDGKQSIVYYKEERLWVIQPVNTWYNIGL